MMSRQYLVLAAATSTVRILPTTVLSLFPAARNPLRKCMVCIWDLETLALEDTRHEQFQNATNALRVLCHEHIRLQQCKLDTCESVDTIKFQLDDLLSHENRERFVQGPFKMAYIDCHARIVHQQTKTIEDFTKLFKQHIDNVVSSIKT